MSTLIHTPARLTTGWYTPADCDLAEFRRLVEVQTQVSDYPHAATVVQNVLIYGPELAAAARETATRREIQAELAKALLDGPGVVVFQQAFDPAVVDAATAAFQRLIDAQNDAGIAVGDHFAKPGANDRIWGALDKLAVAEPATFADYYANDVLALISESWLGPHYQITSQVNVVNPGGQAQVAHRDYHLGFMDRTQAQSYPAQVHAVSPGLTLQGAVAHVEMPIETGPTLFLPHSQKYGPGYVAYHDPEFTAYFDQHYVQLPLSKGDAVFFNPALFHGAGPNRTTDVRRMANLLQVSSAFGRAMEAVDTTAMCKAVYEVLRERSQAGFDPGLVANVITAAAEGYAFPTNLDLDQPIGTMAPPSQADLLTRAINEDWDQVRLVEALDAQQDRRASRAAQ